MNKKFFNSLVFCVCGVLFYVMAADINGRWKGYIDYNGNDVAVAYNFKTEGTKVTGTAETPLGSADIEEGKLEKDVLSFKVNLNGDMAIQTGKVFADSINLNITYKGSEFTTTLKRAKSQ